MDPSRYNAKLGQALGKVQIHEDEINKAIVIVVARETAELKID